MELAQLFTVLPPPPPAGVDKLCGGGADVSRRYEAILCESLPQDLLAGHDSLKLFKRPVLVRHRP